MIGDVTFYPNYIWYAGYDPTAEPSIVTQNYASSGGETTGGVYDLVDGRRGPVLTLDTNGESGDPAIDLDLTNSISTTFMILDNHNMATADLLLTARYGAGNSSISLTSAYSGSLGSALASDGSGTLIRPTSDGISLLKYASLSSQYWNIVFGDFGGANYDADMIFGEFFVGKSFSPSFAPDTPTEISDLRGIGINETPGGQKYSVKRFGARRGWSLHWPIMTESDMSELQTIFEDITEGPRYPFYIDLGEAATPQLYFVRFVDKKLNIKKLTAQAYDVSFTIESEV